MILYRTPAHVIGILAVVCVIAVPAWGEVLTARDAGGVVTLRIGDRARAYTPLRRAETLHYTFCGQGDLTILSRAMLAPGADAARYTLWASIDGATPERELSYRADVVRGASFGDGERSAALRRVQLPLARGCHTVRLELPRATAPRVAVRVLWDVAPATKRPWQPAVATRGAQPMPLLVGDRRTDYHDVAGGAALGFDVEGPAWVRVLARPAGQREAMSYTLSVADNGKTLRRYLLDSRPSRRARRADGQPVGVANEVVFPVAAGRHRLDLRASPGLPIMMRAESAPAAASAAAARDTGDRWRLRGRLASYYDDNILRYSQRFIDRFERGQDPGRFRVESLDDVIQRLDLYLHRAVVGLGRRPASIGLDVEHRSYTRNGIKDWTRVAASFRQELGLGRQITVRASWIPSFYVRHLRDSDLTGGNQGADPFQAFEFDRAELRLGYAHEPTADLDLSYHLGRADFRHSDAFVEFDSENLFAGVRLDHRLSRGWRVSYAAEHVISDARGYDEVGETLATSDDTDPAYRQTDLMLAARYRFSGPRRATVFVQAERGLRTYTTDKPPALAPLHAGREDDLSRLYASWQRDLTSRYGITVFGQLRDRSSTAPVRLDIGDEKDYEQYELGVRLSARFGG